MTSGSPRTAVAGAPAIGIDIASIARVAALAERVPRFRERAFTPAEQRHCAGKPERWAARWAAKEAVRKLAGGLGMPLPGFRDVEVLSAPGTPPALAVRGWDIPVALSLSHDADSAVAVAIAPLPGGPQPWPPPSSPPPAGVRLPPRTPDAHKGTFGTVVVVGGAPGFAGAPVLAALGAARGGAGLVRACVPASIHAQVAAQCLEVMAHPLPASDRGSLAPEAVDVLVRDHLASARAVVIGPGLTTDPPTREAVISLLGRLTCPTVVDADALNIAAACAHEWSRSPVEIVITPHPAEMGRLAGLSVAEVQANRVEVASRYAREGHVTVVLKGSGTVVAAADGRVHRCEHAVVALASGGTGDVLGGLVAAMLAQGLDGFDAAVAAVTIHAEAGAAVQAIQGRAGVLAGDVVAELPRAQERLRRALEAGPG